MHRFIPSSGDAFIAHEKLFPNAGTTLNDICVQSAFLQPECTLSIYPFHGSQKGYVPLGQSENTSAHDRGGLCIAVQKNRLINSANITSAVFEDTIMAYRLAH